MSATLCTSWLSCTFTALSMEVERIFLRRAFENTTGDGTSRSISLDRQRYKAWLSSPFRQIAVDAQIYIAERGMILNHMGFSTVYQRATWFLASYNNSPLLSNSFSYLLYTAIHDTHRQSIIRVLRVDIEVHGEHRRLDHVRIRQMRRPPKIQNLAQDCPYVTISNTLILYRKG